MISPRARFRATHQSRNGPMCPMGCGQPLGTHYIQITDPRARITKVRNGQTSRPCFEVLVR